MRFRLDTRPVLLGQETLGSGEQGKRLDRLPCALPLEPPRSSLGRVEEGGVLVLDGHERQRLHALPRPGAQLPRSRDRPLQHRIITH